MSSSSLPLTFALLLVLGLAATAIAQEPSPFVEPRLDQATQDGVQVQTRGPVHEAFAEPVGNQMKPTIVAKQAPPEPIEELAPDVKPEGENVIWVPGYWYWDDEANQYGWVSGGWRVAPNNMIWVSGYWAQQGDGWIWTPGFWTPSENQALEYLPQPPETLEQGPTSAAPSNDHYWVPGCWMYRETRYAWRTGYWARVQPEWVWVPAHYVFTPRGWVFVAGYWDRPFDERGVLFAPVCFERPVYLQPRWYYRPAVVVDFGVVGVHLWARPNYCHYYFGDFYDPVYANVGYYPWFSWHTRIRGGYDPLFVHYRWKHGRNDRDWLAHLERRHRDFCDHKDRRPKHTFKEQRDWERRHGDDRSWGSDVKLANNFDKFVEEKKGRNEKFVSLTPEAREEIRKKTWDHRDFVRERKTVEGESKKGDGSGPSKFDIRGRGLGAVAVAGQQDGERRSADFFSGGKTDSSDSDSGRGGGKNHDGSGEGRPGRSGKTDLSKVGDGKPNTETKNDEQPAKITDPVAGATDNDSPDRTGNRQGRGRGRTRGDDNTKSGETQAGELKLIDPGANLPSTGTFNPNNPATGGFNPGTHGPANPNSPSDKDAKSVEDSGNPSDSNAGRRNRDRRPPDGNAGSPSGGTSASDKDKPTFDSSQIKKNQGGDQPRSRNVNPNQFNAGDEGNRGVGRSYSRPRGEGQNIPRKLDLPNNTPKSLDGGAKSGSGTSGDSGSSRKKDASKTNEAPKLILPKEDKPPRVRSSTGAAGPSSGTSSTLELPRSPSRRDFMSRTPQDNNPPSVKSYTGPSFNPSPDTSIQPRSIRSYGGGGGGESRSRGAEFRRAPSSSVSPGTDIPKASSSTPRIRSSESRSAASAKSFVPPSTPSDSEDKKEEGQGIGRRGRR